MNYTTFCLLLILDSRRHTKTLESFYTVQKWEKTSKTTSKPVTAVKSTSPADRSPQHHFNLSYSRVSLAIHWSRLHHKLAQEQRKWLNSRTRLLPVQDGSFHPNINSFWRCQSSWALHRENLQTTWTCQYHYLRLWSRLHVSVLEVSVQDSGNGVAIQHSFSSRDGWTNRTSAPEPWDYA